MAYATNNRPRQYPDNGRNGRGQDNGPAYNGQYGYSQNPQAPKKSTGCKIVSSYTNKKTGEHVDSPYITGWNKSQRNGFVSFIASPCKDAKTSNPRWHKWLVKFRKEGANLEELTSGFWDGKTLHMPDLQMIARPSSPNGGYWGTNKKR